MKRLICSFIVVLICVCCFATPAMAKPIEASGRKHKQYSEKPTEGIESPYKDFGKGYIILEPSSEKGISLQSDTIVISGDTYITRLSSNEVSGYAETVLSHMVDTVGYIMKFQIWDGYDWITFADATKERSNYRSVRGFHDKKAEPGYYYRLKMIFYYRHNGEFDSLTGYSHYIKL